MFRLLFLLALVCTLGCSNNSKLEVPKDAKAAPTVAPIIMGGSAGPTDKK